jgi:cell division initiation protein
MKLTPLEIRKMDFNRSMRGYNPDEVRAFLETVAEQVELLQRDVNDFSDKIIRLETRLSDFQMMEKTLQETLLKAEESARRSREDSQREAQITLREAEVEVQRIMAEGRSTAEKLKAEILMLENRKDTFIRKLKYLLQSESDLIEIIEGKELTPEPGPTGSTHGDYPTTVG